MNTFGGLELTFVSSLVPAEVRNSIYRYALVYDIAINGYAKIDTIGLFYTNKQVHDEASSIFYGENTFTFDMEIDWTDRPEIQLHNFPKKTCGTGIWPPKRYHAYLTKLHIRFTLNAGEPHMLEAPPIYPMQLKAFRKSFDECWNQLHPTWEFMSLPILTFTSAWTKLSLFEPLYHPNCEVILDEEALNPAGTLSWILLVLLQGRDPRGGLSSLQKTWLNDCLIKSRAMYEGVRKHEVSDALADRLAVGDFAFTYHILSNLPNSGDGLIMGGPDLETQQIMEDRRNANPNNQQPVVFNGANIQFNIFGPPPVAPQQNATKKQSAMAVANRERGRYNRRGPWEHHQAVRNKYQTGHTQEAIDMLVRDTELRIGAYYALKGFEAEEDEGVREYLLPDVDWDIMMAKSNMELVEQLSAMAPT